MNFSLKQALKVLVVFACAVGVVGTSVMITNKNTDNAKNKNDSLWNVVDGDSDSSSDNNNPTSGPNGEPLVSKTESQVGKYADIDGDGTVDGIIFADLIVGGSGEWINNGEYSVDKTPIKYNIPTISSSKDYYVSQKNYTNKLGGTADVLTPTGNGDERFYIVALNEVDLFETEGAYWYYAASNYYDNYVNATSPDFGAGRQNTLTMIEKWNNEEYGEKNKGLKEPDARYKKPDIWDKIKNEVNNGWFVPSNMEFIAFLGQLNINSDNYLDKGIYDDYWTSTQDDTVNQAYSFEFYPRNLHLKYVDSAGRVRLATTF